MVGTNRENFTTLDLQLQYPSNILSCFNLQDGAKKKKDERKKEGKGRYKC